MSEDSLFFQEEHILRKAVELAESGVGADESWLPHYKELIEAYENLLSRTQRLVRISDRMALSVIVLNEKLASEVERRTHAEGEKGKLVEQLQEALSHVKTLSGLLPICAACKRIRDDQGYWQQIEAYLREHSEADFTHSICPECTKKLYPELYGDKS